MIFLRNTDFPICAVCAYIILSMQIKQTLIYINIYNYIVIQIYILYMCIVHKNSNLSNAYTVYVYVYCVNKKTKKTMYCYSHSSHTRSSGVQFENPWAKSRHTFDLVQIMTY